MYQMRARRIDSSRLRHSPNFLFKVHRYNTKRFVTNKRRPSTSFAFHRHRSPDTPLPTDANKRRSPPIGSWPRRVHAYMRACARTCVHAAGNSFKKKFLRSMLVFLSPSPFSTRRSSRRREQQESWSPPRKNSSFDCIKCARFRTIYNTLISANKETLIIKPEQNIV
jgi:hypothetical protein